MLLMSTTMATGTDLTDKQRRILSYLRDETTGRSYFKSRLIGDELDMTAKEVGTNMTAIADGDFELTVERWGYSSGTTWMVSTETGE